MHTHTLVRLGMPPLPVARTVHAGTRQAALPYACGTGGGSRNRRSPLATHAPVCGAAERSAAAPNGFAHAGGGKRQHMGVHAPTRLAVGCSTGTACSTGTPHGAAHACSWRVVHPASATACDDVGGRQRGGAAARSAAAPHAAADACSSTLHPSARLRTPPAANPTPAANSAPRLPPRATVGARCVQRRAGRSSELQSSGRISGSVGGSGSAGGNSIGGGAAGSAAEFPHVSVLLQETLDVLAPVDLRCGGVEARNGDARADCADAAYACGHTLGKGHDGVEFVWQGQKLRSGLDGCGGVRVGMQRMCEDVGACGGLRLCLAMPAFWRHACPICFV
eukprot:354541-Chlamydomonas_euryale.AAC.2